MRGAVIACAAGLASVLAGVGRAQTASFTSSTELVVVQASVRDRHGRPIGDLTADAFQILDEGKIVPVSVFSNADEPVTIGLVVDSSISMQPIRTQVLEAASAFLEAVHSDSELFAIAFNEQVRNALPAEAPFTSDPVALRAALDTVAGARGKTALYDAVGEGLRYASRGRFPRRSLVVITDGTDNASSTTLDETLARLREGDVVVHAVALTDPVEPSRPDVLKRMATETGGEFLRPENTPKIRPLLTKLADDLRHAYMLGFKPAAADGRFHRIQLSARDGNGARLQVRTRAGYMSRAGDFK